MQKRLFCLILALVMVLSLCPVVSAESANVTISGLHNAQVCRAALYALSEGSPEGNDFLSGVSPEADGYEFFYSLSLPDGEYRLEGFDENGDLNGSISFTVKAGAENNFRVQRIYDLHAQNSGWVEGKDYAISVSVTSADGQNRAVSFGKAKNYDGAYVTSCLFFVGDRVSAVFTPIGDYAADYLPSTVTDLPKINRSMTATIYEGMELSFLTPAGSTVSSGTFSDYYLYRFFTPSETVEVDQTLMRTTFRIPKMRAGNISGTNFFYRVQNPAGVTYWDYFDPLSLKSDTIEVTASQLYLENNAVDAKTVVRDFRYNTFDKADIYLSGNKQGCLPLKTGETFELDTFRNWMAIESIYNAKVALPDTHYTVVDMNGNPSDVLTVTPDENNSSMAVVRANKSGTAIVLVTYDAMTYAHAYVSGNVGKSCLFSAIWPENTGVLVFTVDEDGSSILTGMMLGGSGEGYEIDAELDPLFYVGDAGASYTFTPEAGCTVSINRGVVTDTLTFAGFTTDGVTCNDDGSVTVSGLTTGKHIVRVEKDGVATYQVLTAKQTAYTVSGENIRAGSTADIQFTGLVNPVEKMSGFYNGSAVIRYVGADGTVFTSNPGGAFGVYDFSSVADRQKFTVTIPRYFDGDAYTISSGSIAMRLFGSAPGGHRTVSYREGVDRGFTAPSVGSFQGMLPDISIPVEPTDFLTGTLVLKDQDGKAVSLDGLSITIQDTDGYETFLRADGTFPCFSGEYSYTVSGEDVEDAQGTFTVTDSGEIGIVLTRKAAPSKFRQILDKIAAFFGKVWQAIKLPFLLLIEWIRSLKKS